MDHVAIMKKSWGLVPKILSGEKKIESRWYLNRVSPWGKINAGDIVYFKNSGEKVKLKAIVDKIIKFENINRQEVRKILEEYSKDDGIEDSKKEFYYELFKDKKYCLLVFLKEPMEVVEFDIDKKGFGIQCAWLCVEDINKIKII